MPDLELDQPLVQIDTARQEPAGMDISVTDAKSQLTDLVKRAEAGEDVVLTRHGQAVGRLVPVRPRKSPEELQAFLERIMAEGAAQITPGPSAARSQDFLYDENGLPR